MREREEREGDRLVAGGGSPGVAPLRQRGGVGGVGVSYAAVLLVVVHVIDMRDDVWMITVSVELKSGKKASVLWLLNSTCGV